MEGYLRLGTKQQIKGWRNKKYNVKSNKYNAKKLHALVKCAKIKKANEVEEVKELEIRLWNAS